MVDEQAAAQEAKQIMDNFMASLKNIDVEESFILHRDEFSREDSSECKELDEEFKTRFLQNAPKHTSEAIVANKGTWVE